MSLSNRDHAEMAVAYGTQHGKTHEQIVDMLDADGLLMPDPQIIRTPAELELCDHNDVFAVKWGVENWVGLATAVNNGWPTEPFPAVKVAEGAHLRAARTALEKDTTND